MDSNTTLVKVKLKNSFSNGLTLMDSNTTLVKVKYEMIDDKQIGEINSNTTLVKVKSSMDAQSAALALQFKYNSC